MDTPTPNAPCYCGPVIYAHEPICTGGPPRPVGLARVREIQAHAKIARWADQQVARSASHGRALDRYLALSDGGDWPEDH